MRIFPAIDIINGEVVRLFQGDYEKKQTFGKNPVEFAKKFNSEGAEFLHVVDLDGAKEGKPCNFEIVEIMTKETSLYIEIGGGIRTEESIVKYLNSGVKDVILGTTALKDPAFTKKMVEKYGEKIVVGIDARDGKVATHGWLETSEVDSIEFCREMKKIGVKRVIYTDISKDGAESGTNLKIYEKLSGIGLDITASGGVSTIDDIKQLREMELYGAIVGKALYTGAIKLKDLDMVGGKI